MGAYQPLLGFRDFYPKNQKILNFLCQTVRKTATSFGFEEYSSPVLEPLELFTAKSGDEIVDQLFNFVDKGGRAVALRPEMTPSVVRMVGANYSAVKKPIKWFNIAENFRYERPQKGRLRAFYQFNFDIFGEDSCYADAEIISLIISIMRSLKLQDFCVRISDRELWVAFLRATGVAEDNMIPILSIIDKSERENPEKTRNSLLKLCPEYAERLYTQILNLKTVHSIDDLNEFLVNNQLKDSTEIQERVRKFQKLLNVLDDFKALDSVVIDFSIVRGLAYYTGFVFEVFDRELSSRALAGGGRYDTLAEKLGYQHIPAVGAAIGDVTLVDFLSKKGLLPNTERGLDCFVIFEETCRSFAFQVTNFLRNNGFSVDFSMHELSFDKQFKSAIDRNARFAVICGEQEKARKEIKLKDLITREEVFLPLDKLVDRLHVGEAR